MEVVKDTQIIDISNTLLKEEIPFYTTDIVEIPDDANPIEYINTDLEQNINDEATVVEFLNSVSEDTELMPSCKSLNDYTSSEIFKHQDEIIEFDEAINHIELEKEDFIRQIGNKCVEEYNKVYLPNYRRELRKWYLSRHKDAYLTRDNELIDTREDNIEE